MSNIFTIVVHRRGNEKDVSGTIPELIEYFRRLLLGDETKVKKDEKNGKTHGE